MVSALPRGTWFSSVGAALREPEESACRTYLAGVGLPHTRVRVVTDWREAARLYTPTVQWTSHEVECDEARRLFLGLTESQSTQCTLMRLANLMQGSAALLHAAASRACRLGGFDDPELAALAAGSAAQTLHQFALAALSRRAEQHPFAAKFRLFLCGRWPLRLEPAAFYVF